MQEYYPPAKVLRTEHEVKNRLNEFGFKKDDVRQICERVLYGRNLRSSLQPKTAEGLLKYIFGVEGLRQVALSLSSDAASYEVFSHNNIEGVFDSDNGRKIMFQMADQACGEDDPQPKSKIGDGKKKLINDSAQVFLFPEFEEEERCRVIDFNARIKAECWYLIVSIDPQGSLCCELSHSRPIDEDNERMIFSERIQIFGPGDFDPDPLTGRDDDSGDGEGETFKIKPTITRK